MATKTLTQPITWKRITTTAALNAYVGAPGEPFIDFRDPMNPSLRIGNGVTPGGHVVQGGEGGIDAVSAPKIIAPVNGATNVASSPIITASAFVGMLANSDPDTHAASVWRFSTNSAMTNIIYTSGRTTSDKTSIDLSGKHSFSGGQTIYVDVEYEGGSGVKARSGVISFTVQSISVGGTYEGDVVVGQVDGDWLLVAPASLRVLRTWNDGSSSYVDTPLPNDPNPDPNTCTHNTNVLVGLSQDHRAAQYARSIGYDLPNRQALQMIYDNRAAIDAADESISGGTVQPSLANIAANTARDGANTRSTAVVWSSTEDSSTSARYLYFFSGSWSYGHKNYESWVVPVRRISL